MTSLTIVFFPPEFCPVSTLPKFEGSAPIISFPYLTRYPRILYQCKTGYKPINEKVSVMVCNDGTWKPKKDFCKSMSFSYWENVFVFVMFKELL